MAGRRRVRPCGCPAGDGELLPLDRAPLPGLGPGDQPAPPRHFQAGLGTTACATAGLIRGGRVGPARVRVGRQGRGTPGEPAESGSGALAPFRDRQTTRVRLTLVLTSASIAVQEVPFDLAEVKLVAPSIRPGTVAKADVIGRLCTASAPFTTLVAGAGYGKTTLLARWAQADPRPFAWVALDGRDGDAVVLLRYIAAAIHRVEPLSREVFDALSGPGASSWATRVPRIGRALADLKRSLVLVLDDLHLVASRSCLDALAELFHYVPAGSKIAVASREEPALPLARWRAQGGYTRLGSRICAWTSTRPLQPLGRHPRRHDRALAQRQQGEGARCARGSIT